VMYPKALLDQLGWYDEDFFLIYEDVDLALRARHAGHQVLFVPESRILHKSSASLGGSRSASSFYYSERNHLPLMLKNLPLPVLLRYLPGLLCAKTFRIYRTLKTGCFGAYVRGNIASLGLIPRFLGKRRRVLGASRLRAADLGSLFRKNFFRERLAFHRGNYDISV